MQSTLNATATESHRLGILLFTVFILGVEAAAYSPVHCVEHFNHDKHGKGHSHGLRVPKDRTVNARESTLLSQALRLVCLRAETREKGDAVRTC